MSFDKIFDLTTGVYFNFYTGVLYRRLIYFRRFLVKESRHFGTVSGAVSYLFTVVRARVCMVCFHDEPYSPSPTTRLVPMGVLR